MPSPRFRPHTELAHDDEVTSISFSSDDQFLATTSSYTVSLWATATGDLVHALSHPDTGDYWSICVACHPSLPLVVAGSVDGLLTSWLATTGDLLRSARLHEASVLAVAFSPDGTTLASASLDGSVRLFRQEDGAQTGEFHPIGAGVQALAFHPHGSLLACGSCGEHGPSLAVWDLRRNVQQVACALGSPVTAVSWESDGRLLAAVTEQGRAVLIEAASGASVADVGCDADRYTALRFIAPELLVLGSAEGGVAFWETGQRTLVEQHQAYHAAVWMIACSHDGRRLATASEDTTALLWDV